MDVVADTFHEGVVLFSGRLNGEVSLDEDVNAEEREHSERNHDESALKAQAPHRELVGGLLNLLAGSSHNVVGCGNSVGNGLNCLSEYCV